MDYKNFIIRSLVSILFLILYILIGLSNKYYLYILTFLFYLFVIFEIIFNFKFKPLIILYILFSFSFFTSYLFYYFDYIIFNLFIITIISFDIFSYIFGSIIGKKKVLPKISPNKTYEGLIYGIICSNICSLYYIYIFIEISVINILFINLLIITSFCGDIFESYFKRISNIKNSSNIIPGHGGFFDRIDSFLLSFFVLYLFSVLL